MIPTPILDELQALLEKAPQMPWFQIDDQPYLHFAKDGKRVAGAKPWDHPVVGRFDYGKGAMQLIELLSQHLPQLIAAARELEEAKADYERVMGLLTEQHIAHSRMTVELEEVRRDAERWKERAEYEYGLRRNADDPAMAVGALDAHMKTWKWEGKDDAVNALLAAQKEAGE